MAAQSPAENSGVSQNVHLPYTGIEQLGFMYGFVRMCSDGWDQGWHERNGGNATYRLTEEDISAAWSLFADVSGPWCPLARCVPSLAGEFFVVTRTGGYMRNLACDTQYNAGIIEIDGRGSAYRCVWGLVRSGLPTSELLGHLLIHAQRKKASGGTNRVLYHCHPVDIAALTCALPPDSKTITLTLWKMMTECIVVFPEGIGVVPFKTPGSIALAEQSARLMDRQRAVIWAHHGLICAGDTFDDAFGLAHVIVKAASIYRSACAMCATSDFAFSPTDDDLRAIAAEFGLSPGEGLL